MSDGKDRNGQKERARNVTVGMRRIRRVMRRIRSMSLQEFKRYIPMTAEMNYYRRIRKLVPELASYKAETVLHVRAKAEERGCRNLRQYYQKLKNDPEEIRWLRPKLTLMGTHFFRGDDWGYFIENALSKFEGRKGLRVWCAGCSSGEEAYSVLTALLDYVPLEEIDVLATDYNEELLEKCRAGSYFNMHLPEIPERYQKYVEQGKSRFTFLPELRAAIRTRPLNLLTDVYPAPFDVILCRNVIKFFSWETIPQVQRKLAASLSPGGFLFLSADDDHNDIEMIVHPHEMGLQQLENRCIYRKHA